MSSPFDSTPSCPHCGESTLSNLTARANGKALGKAEAFSFLLSEGEAHGLVSVECDSCGEVTARSITNVER